MSTNQHRRPAAATPCQACGATPPAAARFCPVCGRRRSEPSRSDLWVPLWSMAGFVVLSVLVVAVWSGIAVDDPLAPGAPDAAMTSPIPPEATLDLATVDPRVIADNMFNHVVDAAAAGDSAELANFLDLAVDAYESARPLDPDGLFHLSTLHRIAARPADALASAREILDGSPDHLLGLGAAAAAASDLGQSPDARVYYAHLISVYEVEVARPLTEYVGHETFISRSKADAEAFLESS